MLVTATALPGLALLIRSLSNGGQGNGKCRNSEQRLD
jgi:hypothetical protein